MIDPQTLFKMRSFGSGLVHLGCQPNNQTMVLLYGKNNFKVRLCYFVRLVGLEKLTEYFE